MRILRILTEKERRNSFAICNFKQNESISNSQFREKMNENCELIWFVNHDSQIAATLVSKLKIFLWACNNLAEYFFS